MNKGKLKNSVPIDEFKLEMIKSNIVLNFEIEDYNVIALDLQSLSDKSKKIELRNVLGLGTSLAICDYLIMDTKKNKFCMVEITNLSNMFNNKYERDHKLLDEIINKIQGTLEVLSELTKLGKIKTVYRGIKFKIIFVIEGNTKNATTFQQLSNDIANTVKAKYDYKTEVVYSDEFWKKHKKIIERGWPKY